MATESKTNGNDPTLVAESSELLAVAESSGEVEITLDGGDCRVQIRGPRREGEDMDWVQAYRDGLETWTKMHAIVHAARLEEIRVEQGGRVGPASAGFIQEGMHERRNEGLPGGTGARPV